MLRHFDRFWPPRLSPFTRRSLGGRGRILNQSRGHHTVSLLPLLHRYCAIIIIITTSQGWLLTGLPACKTRGLSYYHNDYYPCYLKANFELKPLSVKTGISVWFHVVSSVSTTRLKRNLNLEYVPLRNLILSIVSNREELVLNLNYNISDCCECFHNICCIHISSHYIPSDGTKHLSQTPFESIFRHLHHVQGGRKVPTHW